MKKGFTAANNAQRSFSYANRKHQAGRTSSATKNLKVHVKQEMEHKASHA